MLFSIKPLIARSATETDLVERVSVLELQVLFAGVRNNAGSTRRERAKGSIDETEVEFRRVPALDNVDEATLDATRKKIELGQGPGFRAKQRMQLANWKIG